jgi:hypothetical protein
MGVAEKIKAIENEMASTKYHKGTEHHFGVLKSKLAKLRKEQMKSGKKGGKRFAVRKSGDATVVLIGPASAGKSSLFNSLTNRKSEVGEHPFTTQEIVPGMMSFNGAQIQILDTPSLEIAKKEVLSVAAIADLTVLVLDVFQREFDEIVNELNATKTGDVLVVVNKVDARDIEYLKFLREKFGSCVCVSVNKLIGIEELKNEIYKKLKLIRIYMKPKGEKVDYSKPLVVRSGSTVGGVWDKLHLLGEMDYAVIWGKSAKFGGQKVNGGHVLADGDVLTIVRR